MPQIKKLRQAAIALIYAHQCSLWTSFDPWVLRRLRIFLLPAVVAVFRRGAV
jgi:hypothetical protein